MEIANLEVKIASDAQAAAQALDRLAASASKLKNAIKIDTTSIEKLSKLNGQSLQGVATAMSGISSALNGIDAGKIKSTAEALSEFADSAKKLNNTLAGADFNKSVKDITEFNRLISNETATLIKDFGIKGTENTQNFSAAVRDLLKAVQSLDEGNGTIEGVQTAMNNLKKEVSENARFFDESKRAYADLIEYIRSTNASGTKVYLPFDPSEFIDDYNSMRSTLGKAFTSDESAKSFIDIETYVRELNDALGQTIPIENNAADTFRNLVEALREGRNAYLVHQKISIKEYFYFI